LEGGCEENIIKTQEHLGYKTSKTIEGNSSQREETKGKVLGTKEKRKIHVGKKTSTKRKIK